MLMLQQIESLELESIPVFWISVVDWHESVIDFPCFVWNGDKLSIKVENVKLNIF